MSTLIPNYLNLDFDTLKEKFKTVLANSDTFADVNYEGSNISVLIELLSYVGELNTFYLNKIAKNLFLESSELFETTHSLGLFLGYKPRGYVSSFGNINIKIQNTPEINGDNGGFNIGDILYIGQLKQVTGDGISYLISDALNFVADTAIMNIEANVIQGTVKEFVLDWEDMLTDKFLLQNYKYAHNPDTTTAFLYINGEQWEQKDSLYKNISIYKENKNVFELTFDKYKRYNILFSGYGNKPQKNDTISLQIIESLGAAGNLGPLKINSFEEYFVFNITQGRYIDKQCITVTNDSIITGGEDYNEIDYIKLQGKCHFNSQERLVTKNDYISHLRSIPEIASVNVYGEQEIAPLGDIMEYNKIHIAIFPDEWGPATIDYTTTQYTFGSKTSNLLIPTTINEQFKADIKERLKIKKFMNTFEVFDLPELVYFAFRFGIKEKPLYSYDSVAINIKNKILEYFSLNNIKFGMSVDFRDIQNWILNPKTSTIDITGLETFIIRDLDCINYTINDYNKDVINCPQFASATQAVGVENKLRKINLNYKQMAQIAMNLCVFVREI